MKKKYHLTYKFLGEARRLEFDNLFDFYNKLDGAMNDPHVFDMSICFWTENIES